MEIPDDVWRAAAEIPLKWIRASPGEQLYALRCERRVSQRVLAALAGVTPAAVCRLEAGRDARLSTWRRLFQALGYYAPLVPVSSCEDADDWCIEEMERREERMLAQLRAGR